MCIPAFLLRPDLKRVYASTLQLAEFTHQHVCLMLSLFLPPPTVLPLSVHGPRLRVLLRCYKLSHPQLGLMANQLLRSLLSSHLHQHN